MSNAEDNVDLLVIGGGINGAGIACDAAGRGLTVALSEQDDLASATSSASSKLIHGGLRYLEHYEFRLVRESLSEREILMTKAGHIVHPLRFVLPHQNAQRPAWMIRMGLFLYDHLTRRHSLPGSSGVNLERDDAGAVLKEGIARGFSYFDCKVDDSRLVVLNAMAAAANGARIMTRTRLVGAERHGASWLARLKDLRDDREFTIQAKALVNAAGPWAKAVAEDVVGVATKKTMRLVKGSHIVVPRLYDANHAYILQNTDHRVVFVIPFEERFSLIGTTEVAFQGDPAKAEVDEDEKAYLLVAVNGYFRTPIEASAIRWAFAGVRPLFDDDASDPSSVTRDYALEVDTKGGAPAVSVFGGKITTYRRLAEQVLDKLQPHFPGLGTPWTATSILPGGDLGADGFLGFIHTLIGRHPGIDPEYLRGLAGRHGTLVEDVIGEAMGMQDLGEYFGGGLYAREVDFLIDHEWAETADDVLWRRTKTGLHMTGDERAAVKRYMMKNHAAS
ncbi:MAG: glycerol-3-phosphate dehydrogenase [Proteobacteria bacterium]|nr:glycerol-3-phosphate dehydrogenase [Pseudomonadota bacterium]